ncbi:MAG: lamin tail domain-containing protein [Candidatus Bipolaricaulota bacterium]|nr:lamin tail domain-containing protein [Candidatus Bipolaricaulota bacterium]
MKPSRIAFTLLVIVVLPYGAYAQATGTFGVSVGWLSLPLSDLNSLLHTYNYPGVSEHFLSFGIHTLLGVPDFPLRFGFGGQFAFALPESDSEQSETVFGFLYGGLVAEFSQSIPLGQVAVGSLAGIGGAFLNLERSRRGITTFDQALTELLEVSGEFARGYWVAQPYLRASAFIPLGERARGRPINLELSLTAGYVYAFPWGGWGITDEEESEWPGPLDRPSGPEVTLSFHFDISVPPRVVIDSIRYRGNDEVVTLVNQGRREVDVSGWQILSSTVERDRIAQVFVFPQGCVVPAGGRVRVHSGPASVGKTSTPCGQAEIDLYHRYAGLETEGAEVWDDRADLARLQDAYGERIDSCSYQAKPELDATECHK